MPENDRDLLTPILERELAALEQLGVKNVCARSTGYTDHLSFGDRGVPGCAVQQEVAGYRFAHHSQADTLELVREENLIQGVQVLAVTAMRLANLDQLLPRPKN